MNRKEEKNIVET